MRTQYGANIRSNTYNVLAVTGYWYHSEFHITVNSSLYAVGIYEKLGFTKAAEPQEDSGIRFVPMIYRKRDMMTDYENALSVMKEQFDRDYQFALSTCRDNVPSSRFVDTYFDGKSFYIVTYKLSRKAAEIAANPNVSLCGRRMHAFSGQAYIIGHPLDPENAKIRSELIKAFEPWYFKHNNEADENMCYIRIDPTAGFFHKDGTGYRISFTEKT